MSACEQFLLSQTCPPLACWPLRAARTLMNFTDGLSFDRAANTSS